VTLDGLVEHLRHDGFDAEPYLADAGDAQVLRGALEDICATMGAPRVLIYNAARAVNALDPEDLLTGRSSLITDDYEVSIGGVLTCIRALTPQMREIGGGTIVVSSRPPAECLSARFISHSLTITALDALVDVTRTDPRTFPNRVVHVRLPPALAPRRRAPSVAQMYWSLVHPRITRNG
jgi:NAD(P)-dependent dehydrogenase (short-subunit alcohol dehydrogenase family)